MVNQIRAAKTFAKASRFREQQTLVSSSTQQSDDDLPVNSNPASPRSVPSAPARERDNGNKLKPFETNVTQHLRTTTGRVTAMAEEDFTQKTNLSPTQENSPSLYEALELHRSRNQDLEGSDAEFSSSPPILIPRDIPPESQSNGLSHSFKHSNCTHTGSTARTYQENDTGHINFDAFEPRSVPDERHLEFQDPPATFATKESVEEHRFEPESPAPSVNPFSDKGSVMKQHELFSATQPSSIGRIGGSPTSSRPSPDVYNGFREPQENESSPLVKRSEAANGISQGALRSLLRSVSTESPVAVTPTRVFAKTASFDSALRKPTFIREPQDHYVPMKESQERRRMLMAFEVSSGSESDSDIESIPKKQRRAEIDRRVNEDMSRIGLRRPNALARSSSAKDRKSTPVPTSRPSRSFTHQRSSSGINPSHTPQPSASASIAVEVPASGRRRSIQEDYVAQCEGFDARDTQPTQQDMIADSQAAPGSSNFPASSPMLVPRKTLRSSTHAETNGAESTNPSQKLSNPLQQSAGPSKAQSPNSEANANTKEIQCTDSDTPTLSDQDKIALSNQVILVEKVSLEPTSRVQDMLFEGVPSSIPETSQATDRLKPMTEIADVSFGLVIDDQFDDLPGFAVDTAFNEAMELSTYQSPKRQPQPQLSIPATPSLLGAVPIVSAAPASSGLSSAPSVLEPPTPIEQNPITPIVNISESESEPVDHYEHGEDKSAELSELTPTVETSKTQPAKDISSWVSPHNNGAEHQRRPTEEPQSPSSKKQRLESMPHSSPRRSTRNPKIQPKKQTQPKPPTKTNRTTRLLSVSSSVSVSSSAAESDMVTVSTTNSRSSTNSRPRRKGATKAKETIEVTPVPASRQGRSRRSIATDEREGTISAPPSRKKSALSPGEDSEDPLALSSPPSRTVLNIIKPTGNLFNDMAFAVSYVGAEKDKNISIRLIKQHGGRILEDGFENLFTPFASSFKSRALETDVVDTDLEVVSSETNLGFVALIADEHSRKAKYMQALALGLPCISGRWVTDCVDKCTILDWLPYLLSAGNSSYLGGAVKSRYLKPYPATDANLENTFNERLRLLDRKAILIVTGKGKAGDKRKPYVFLTRALGPNRLDQAQDLKQARDMLLQAESRSSDYDLLYVDGKQDVDSVVFGNAAASTTGGSRKRKRASIQEEDVVVHVPKRIRVVNDEIMIQSLIVGQLIEE